MMKVLFPPEKVGNTVSDSGNPDFHSLQWKFVACQEFDLFWKEERLANGVSMSDGGPQIFFSG
jgi:hypothetical protein